MGIVHTRTRNPRECRAHRSSPRYCFIRVEIIISGIRSTQYLACVLRIHGNLHLLSRGKLTVSLRMPGAHPRDFSIAVELLSGQKTLPWNVGRERYAPAEVAGNKTLPWTAYRDRERRMPVEIAGGKIKSRGRVAGNEPPMLVESARESKFPWNAAGHGAVVIRMRRRG